MVLKPSSGSGFSLGRTGGTAWLVTSALLSGGAVSRLISCLTSADKSSRVTSIDLEPEEVLGAGCSALSGSWDNLISSLISAVSSSRDSIEDWTIGDVDGDANGVSTDARANGRGDNSS